MGIKHARRAGFHNPCDFVTDRAKQSNKYVMKMSYTLLSVFWQLVMKHSRNGTRVYGNSRLKIVLLRPLYWGGLLMGNGYKIGILFLGVLMHIARTASYFNQVIACILFS